MNQNSKSQGGRGDNRQRKPGASPSASGQDRQQKKRHRPRGAQGRNQEQREPPQSGTKQGERSERRRQRRPRNRQRGQGGGKPARAATDTGQQRQPAAEQPKGDARPERQRGAKRRIWLETVDRDSGPWFTARAEGGRPLRFTVLFGSKSWDPLLKTPPRELVAGTWVKAVRLEQVHGSQVHLLGSLAHADIFPCEGDALVTRTPGLALVIATADCVPVMLADRRGTTVAAVHAGWRGIAAGLPGKVIQRMSEAFQIQAGRFLAFIGPSISRQGYRVGDEVVQQVAAALPENGMEGVLHQESDGPHLDLEAAVRTQLLAAGLHERSIFGGLPSTDGPEGFFHSHRQSGGSAGRMHSIIYLDAVEEEDQPPEVQKTEESGDQLPGHRRQAPRRVR
jgi:YfiH family protein